MKKLLSLGLLLSGASALNAITYSELTESQQRAAQDQVEYLRTTQGNQNMTVHDLSRVQLQEIVDNDKRDQVRREKALAKRAEAAALEAQKAVEVARMAEEVARQSQAEAERAAILASMAIVGKVEMELVPLAEENLERKALSTIVGKQESMSKAQIDSLKRARREREMREIQSRLELAEKLAEQSRAIKAAALRTKAEQRYEERLF